MPAHEHLSKVKRLFARLFEALLTRIKRPPVYVSKWPEDPK